MKEVTSFLKMLDEVYAIFGLDYTMALSTRPESYLGETRWLAGTAVGTAIAWLLIVALTAAVARHALHQGVCIQIANSHVPSTSTYTPGRLTS
jgi:hypothetical protein